MTYSLVFPLTKILWNMIKSICATFCASRCLTCENVVVMVDIIELDAVVQHVQFFCSQNLSLPVGVAWKKT